VLPTDLLALEDPCNCNGQSRKSAILYK